MYTLSPVADPTGTLTVIWLCLAGFTTLLALSFLWAKQDAKIAHKLIISQLWALIVIGCIYGIIQDRPKENLPIVAEFVEEETVDGEHLVVYSVNERLIRFPKNSAKSFGQTIIVYYND